VPDDFGKILPTTITDAAVRAGDEWIIPFPEVVQAITLAGQHRIAVLGLESFHIVEKGLGCVGYSGYAFEPQEDWAQFVRQNNSEALRFVEDNPRGDDFGYVLTTSSEDEFKIS
jgi:hypothetical protein